MYICCFPFDRSHTEPNQISVTDKEQFRTRLNIHNTIGNVALTNITRFIYKNHRFGLFLGILPFSIFYLAITKNISESTCDNRGGGAVQKVGGGGERRLGVGMNEGRGYRCV